MVGVVHRFKEGWRPRRRVMLLLLTIANSVGTVGRTSASSPGGGEGEAGGGIVCVVDAVSERLCASA